MDTRGAVLRLWYYPHCEIVETLGNPYGLLGRAVLVQMQLAEARRACVIHA
jgi:hypothetical protein